MTSRSLFFKLIREDCKQRLWCLVLAVVVFFFALPVAGALLISSDWNTAEETSRAITSYVTAGGGILLAVTVVGAVVCGISGFAFLQSKKKVDFYHSIPVRREMLFAVFYLDGILLYLVPYLVNLILFLLISAGSVQDQGMLFAQAFRYLGVHLVYYLLIYTVAVLAVMLTGNLLASLLGFCVLSFYGAAVQGVNWLYHRYFYDTFWSDKAVIHYHASPILSYAVTIDHLADEPGGGVWIQGIWVILVWILLLAVTLLLYRKRPSESAERSIAFAGSKPFLYVFISVPAVLAGTMFFLTVTGSYVTVWMIFGLICSWLIVHGILQIVMESEFKAIFRGRIPMGAAGVISAVVLAVFFFDLTGYDSYRPREEECSSVSIAFGNLNENLYGWQDDTYYDHLDIAMEQMTYTDYQTMMKLLEETDGNGSGNEAAVADKVYAGGAEENSLAGTAVYVKYNLSGSRSVYRRYQLTDAASLDMVNQVFVSEEFKEGSYPILTVDEETVTGAYYFNGVETRLLNLDHFGLLELLQAFQEEYRSMTLYEMQEIPYGMLEFVENEERGHILYYVYPFMTETIGLLEEAGMEGWQQAAVNVSTEAVADGSDIYYALEYRGLLTEGEDYTESAVYSGAQLEELLPYLVPGDWIWDNQMVWRRDPWIRVILYAGQDESGAERVLNCYFPAGMVPDFVREDLDYDRYLPMLE